jgi:hypothetical protein
MMTPPCVPSGKATALASPEAGEMARAVRAASLRGLLWRVVARLRALVLARSTSGGSMSADALRKRGHPFRLRAAQAAKLARRGRVLRHQTLNDKAASVVAASAGAAQRPRQQQLLVKEETAGVGAPEQRRRDWYLSRSSSNGYLITALDALRRYGASGVARAPAQGDC